MLMNNTRPLLEKTVAEFVNLKAEQYQDGVLYNKVVALIHELNFQVGQLEESAARETILQVVEPARRRQGLSPFIKRMQTWPRGYPGDFETIEYLLQSVNQAPPHTVEFHCEEYALRSAPPQQHRNKVLEQGNMILATSRQVRRARILSLGCGSCADIYQHLPGLLKSDTEFYLVDLDQDALDFARERLRNLGDQCHFIKSNILKGASVMPELAFDLIIIGGVFDYLPDSLMIRILRELGSRRLNRDGLLFFTNISETNSYRYWMNYFVDWQIIERDETRLREICRRAKLDQSHLTIRRDRTHLTHLVEYRQP